MPNRIILEGLWHGKRITRCSKDAQLHFPRLYLFADDWGCFEIDTAVMKARAYPKMPGISETQITGWLEEYTDNNLLFRWSEGEAEYGYWVGNDIGRFPPVTSRRKRHTPQPPEADLASYLEECHKHIDSRESTKIHKKSRVCLMSKDRSKDRSKEKNVHFETFWKTYPRREGGQKALRCFTTLLAAGEEPDMIIAAAANYAKAKAGTERQFLKLPATFLGPDEHWREYVDVPDENSQEEASRRQRACYADNYPGNCSTPDPRYCPHCPRFTKEASKDA